jgi:hypothetical protein
MVRALWPGSSMNRLESCGGSLKRKGGVEEGSWQPPETTSRPEVTETLDVLR